MSKSVILLGGGYSINEGISQGLWDKLLQSKIDVWSLNFGYLSLPYLPNAQLWVDIMFFNHNMAKLQEMQRKGVKLYAKKHMRHSAITEINQYFTTRNKSEFHGKTAIEKNIIYIGRMGLVGIFATSIAIAEKYDIIYWLGYDFGALSSTTQKTHFYQDKLQVISSGVGKPEIYRDSQGQIRKEVEDFSVFLKEKDVQIFNVSINSNISYYPKISYSEFFSKIEILK